MVNKRVAYYYDPDIGSYTYGLGHPMKPHRMRLTHELVGAYGMLEKMHVLRPKRATAENMTKFHTDEYVHFLSRVSPETKEELTYGGTRFLVLEDNPAWDGLFEFCSISAGGSIAAAQRVATGASDIAINWAGGLHHAKKHEASGFCYINDIVLGILELLRTYPRVLYIDIDCHHGDGVEEAFYTTNRVMTCSFHKFGEYFPGTGTQEDLGTGKGKGYSINLPLKDGMTDESFKSVFEPVVGKIMEVYRPSVVVLQCGADSLAGDKLGCFNITMQGHASCVQFLRKHRDVPLILLGGGGYTVKNVARTWTYETACALEIENDIDLNLPWNDYFEWFGPRFRLEVVENNMDDLNVKEGSLDMIRITALKQLAELEAAPSVGMHDVPRESVGEHTGIYKDDGLTRDELDEQLAQHTRYVYTLQSSSSSPSPSSSSSSSDDEHESAVKRRKRNTLPPSHSRRVMSLMHGKYFDVPSFSGADGNGKRSFFKSTAQWDPQINRVLSGDGVRWLPNVTSIPIVCERGGDRKSVV